MSAASWPPLGGDLLAHCVTAGLWARVRSAVTGCGGRWRRRTAVPRWPCFLLTSPTGPTLRRSARCPSHDLRGQPAVIGHFGSKAKLRLGALDEARACFRREVCNKAESAMPGRARMPAVCKARAIYIDLFLVGSFIAATSFEFDGRAGRVHDVIFDAAATWLKRSPARRAPRSSPANSRRAATQRRSRSSSIPSRSPPSSSAAQ